MNQADSEHVPSRGGRVASAWAKERHSWAERPYLWKFYLCLTTLGVVQCTLALLRGDRWFTGLAAVYVVLGAALTALAYKATRAR